MDFAELSKILLEMYEINKEYCDQIQILMSNPKMIKYMYYKPIRKIYSLHDLIMDYDCTVNLVLVDENEDTPIIDTVDTIVDILDSYRASYFNYKEIYDQISTFRNQHVQKQLSINNWRLMPLNSTFSRNQHIVRRILDKLVKKYKFFYIKHWSFTNDLNQPGGLIYDFYGIFIHNGVLVQFVIECDNDDHFNCRSSKFTSIHINDIIKQYYLFQINVHLLRLNNKSDAKHIVPRFLKTIANTQQYVIWNKIRAIPGLFTSRSKNDDLMRIYNNYVENHNNYLKMDKRADLEENVVYDPKKDINFTSEPADIGFTVSDGVINSILKKSFR
jgi:hypothetical protein